MHIEMGTKQSLKDRIDAVISGRHLLNHKWYVRWQAGSLTTPELQGYAKEYYAFEKEFPRFLSGIHSRAEDREVRRGLLQNLVHEELGADNHPELWLRFAEGLGVERCEVEKHFHSDETENLLRVFRKHSQSPKIEEGLAALYTYESQQPEVARQKSSGLKNLYGFQEESTVAFFKAHEKYDVEHSETELNLLSKLAQTEEQQARVVQVVEETANALYDFLDGVDRRYSPRS